MLIDDASRHISEDPAGRIACLDRNRMDNVQVASCFTTGTPSVNFSLSLPAARRAHARWRTWRESSDPIDPPSLTGRPRPATGTSLYSRARACTDTVACSVAAWTARRTAHARGHPVHQINTDASSSLVPSTTVMPLSFLFTLHWLC